MVFKNQARGTEDKRKKEFVNVRSTVFPACEQAADMFDNRISYVQTSTNGSWLVSLVLQV